MNTNEVKIEMLNELESMGEIDVGSVKPVSTIENTEDKKTEEVKKEEVKTEEPKVPVETEDTQQVVVTTETKKELDDEIQLKLQQLREGAGADEVLLKTIETLEPILRKQKEVDAYLEEQKAEKQRENDFKVLNDLRDDIQKKYGIELPQVKDKAFKKYIDASMSSNPLEMAVLLYHPEAIIKTKSKVATETPSLDKGAKIDNDNYDAAFDAELREASEKSGIPIERLRRWK